MACYIASCDHKQRIWDQHGGCEVCTSCGLVTDNLLTSADPVTIDNEINHEEIYNFLINICENNMIPSYFVKDIFQIYEDYAIIFPNKKK